MKEFLILMQHHFDAVKEKIIFYISSVNLFYKHGSDDDFLGMVVTFETKDYDLDLDEREEKYKDYVRLCEKCNEKFAHVCCDNCYEKEIDEEERNRMLYGKFKECNRFNTNHNWCNECNAKRFQQDFSNWTSENEFMINLYKKLNWIN